MNVLPSQTQLVLDDAAAFDTADDMLDANAHLGNPLVCGFGVWHQFTATRLFLRLLDVHIGHRTPVTAQVLLQDAVGRQRIHLIVGEAFVVPAPFIRRTEEPNAAISANQDEVFERVALLLTTGGAGWRMRVARASDRAFRAIVEHRDGAAGSANDAVCTSVSSWAADREGR